MLWRYWIRCGVMICYFQKGQGLINWEDFWKGWKHPRNLWSFQNNTSFSIEVTLENFPISLTDYPPNQWHLPNHVSMPSFQSPVYPIHATPILSHPTDSSVVPSQTKHLLISSSLLSILDSSNPTIPILSCPCNDILILLCLSVDSTLLYSTLLSHSIRAYPPIQTYIMKIIASLFYS